MVRLKLSFINGKGEWLSRKGAQLTDCDEMSAWTSKKLRECESKWKSLEAEYRARSNI